MAIVTTDSKHYANIADAIREKTGTAEKLAPAQMAVAIADIKDGTEVHNLWLNQAVTELYEPNMTEIGDYQFAGFSVLKRAIFSSVTTAGVYAFKNCKALTEAYFPNLGAITEQMFYETRFSKLDVPAVTSIGSAAFAYNNALVTLILRSKTLVTLANKNAFTGTKVTSGNAYIYVPASLKSEYESATNWSNYANQFRALESFTVDGTTEGELDESKI